MTDEKTSPESDDAGYDPAAHAASWEDALTKVADTNPRAEAQKISRGRKAKNSSPPPTPHARLDVKLSTNPKDWESAITVAGGAATRLTGTPDLEKGEVRKIAEALAPVADKYANSGKLFKYLPEVTLAAVIIEVAAPRVIAYQNQKATTTGGSNVAPTPAGNANFRDTF